MLKSLIILIGVGVWNILISSTAATCNLKADEEVIFFPTAAHWNETRGGWEASIHGWVFEPETDSAAVKSMLALFGKTLGVKDNETEKQIFQSRASLFFADSERNKTIRIKIGKKTFYLKKSGADGHFKDTLFFNPQDLPSEEKKSNTIFYQTVCKNSSRIFKGKIYLLEDEGLSIISDIDDTIKISQVQNKRALIENTFLKDSKKIPEVVSLYQDWEKSGATFHYVSASPWQLYPALKNFVQESKIPSGTFHLKKFRWKDKSFFEMFQSQMNFKTKIIEDILNQFPNRQFIFVGDSGQMDSKIYDKISQKYPDRVLNIIIRDVKTGKLKHRKGFTNPVSTKKMTGDLKEIQQYWNGLASLMKFKVGSENQILNREEREDLWNRWKILLDYFLALENIKNSYQKFQRETLHVSYAAFLTQYRFALEWINRLDQNSELDKVLNEPIPEIGLPEGTYANFKLRFLNVSIASEFAALNTLYKTTSQKTPQGIQKQIEDDSTYIWETGKFKGQVMTAKNALKIIQDAGSEAWLPVQTKVSELMGDTKVYRKNKVLISKEQIHSMKEILEPGDILIERREWVLSNIGLPGFWPHAALYVGTVKEREKYFDDPEVQRWVRSQGWKEGSFEGFLRKEYPKAYKTSLNPYEEDLPRILEAIGEGVSFTSLEHSAHCDSIAILRPRLSKKEKASAILRAFHYAGRPYDFNFDFQTDATLVCSELIYKAYEPTKSTKGLKFDSVDLLGRLVTPPNEMVKQFDREYGTNHQQMDLILFLDGAEWKNSSRVNTLEEFRKSWNRPKWHIWLQ